MLHGGICEAYHQGLARLPSVSGVRPARPLEGRTRPDARRTAKPWSWPPTVANFRQHPELAEEVFGPFAMLISAHNLAELEEVAARTRGAIDRDGSRHAG